MGETGRYDTHLTVDQALEIKPVYVEDCDDEGGYSHQGINLIRRMMNTRSKRSKDIETNQQSNCKLFSFSLHNLKGTRQIC